LGLRGLGLYASSFMRMRVGFSPSTIPTIPPGPFP
jgi:hypothetical protein